MQGHPATLYCSNLTCQSPNLETDAYCQHCQTPLLKRYLWLIGTASPPYQIGDWVCDRYLFKGDRIVLDTQPYLPPHTTPDVPSGIEHYLRLFPYRLHVPQVYGLLDPQKPHLWLLEEGALCAADLLLNSPELVTRPPREPAISDSPAAFASPQLVNVWQFASALRQLNWLWQIAQLWQPLCTEGVASSLLQPELVRVSGSVIRLLELATDAHPPTLTDLGHTWKTWLTGASPEITPFLGDLCLKLLGNQMTSISSCGYWDRLRFASFSLSLIVIRVPHAPITKMPATQRAVLSSSLRLRLALPNPAWQLCVTALVDMTEEMLPPIWQ
jgi:hypothetical protein